MYLLMYHEYPNKSDELVFNRCQFIQIPSFREHKLSVSPRAVNNHQLEPTQCHLFRLYIRQCHQLPLSLFFCSTSLPIACTRWVRLTIKLMHCPHTKQHTAVDKSLQHQENLGNAENRTWVSCFDMDWWAYDGLVFYNHSKGLEPKLCLHWC